METSRRNFIKKTTAAGIGAAGLAIADKTSAMTTALETQVKKKTTGNNDGKLRFGFIGTGGRCQMHIRNVLTIGSAKIVAICDIRQTSIDNTLKNILEFNVETPKVYLGDVYEFEKMLNNEEFDCIIIASPWEWHTTMAVAAMKAGVPYVGVEVSAANTLEECWDLVNVSESTGNQVCILENVCYRRDCMAALRMVREGLLGELLHCECGYQHDLRAGKIQINQQNGKLLIGEEASGEAQWRTNHSIHRNGDVYPTHGIGPVAECMNINRGNRFVSISSMATKSRGLHKYAIDHGKTDDPITKINFNLGDIVNSMIKCANGETIIVTHDTNTPRPYSLRFRIQGTRGLWMNDGDHVYVEGESKPHQWDDSEKWFEKYDHKLWTKLGEAAVGGGHGGMDYVMMYDFIEAVKNKAPLPIDCYDAAAWSAISALSEYSIARGGELVDFPDFTRGKWINRKPSFAII